ncbi:hypothetical protein LZ32DRAFT_545560, partial [Colletotrichum eremochloae]
TTKEYKYYLYTIFSLFTKKNLVLLLRKLFISFPSIELLGFYINIFSLSNIEDYTKTI